MANLWNWFLDRMRERKSKQMITLLLGTLVLIGVLPDGTDQAATDIIETGQDLYHEGADSLASTIETGRDLYEEGKGAVLRTVETGSYFWSQLLAILLAIGSFVGGLFTKDAKAGREYAERERSLIQALRGYGVQEAEIERLLN